MIRDSKGNLYGTTAGGGAYVNLGTVFELAHGSSTITTLASFNGTDGGLSNAALILDNSGNLYGTTEGGGALGGGTVFELSGAISADVPKVGLLVGGPNPVAVGQMLSQSGPSLPASHPNGDGIPIVAFHQDANDAGHLKVGTDTDYHGPGFSASRRIKALKSLTPSFVDSLFSYDPTLQSGIQVGG